MASISAACASLLPAVGVALAAPPWLWACPSPPALAAAGAPAAPATVVGVAEDSGVTTTTVAMATAATPPMHAAIDGSRRRSGAMTRPTARVTAIAWRMTQVRSTLLTSSATPL